MLRGEDNNEAEIIIEGVDTSVGIMTCGGSIEGYIGVLEAFCFAGKTQLVDISTAYSKNDIHRFNIEVHALKSAAWGIGASSLGNLAYRMEQAASKADNEFIDRHYHELIVMLADLVKRLNSFLDCCGGKHSINKTPIDLTFFTEKLTQIIRHANNYDMERASLELDAIFSHEINVGHHEKLREIKNAVLSFLYAEVADKAGLLIAEIRSDIK